MEMRYYHKILRTSYKDRFTNEEFRAKIQQAIGPHDDFLTSSMVRSIHLARHNERGKKTKQTEE